MGTPRVPTEAEVERIRLRVQEIAKRCGIEVNLASLTFRRDPPGCDALIEHSTDELSFDESLAKLAEALGTRDINLSCDLGYSSDRSHDHQIWVKNIKVENLS